MSSYWGDTLTLPLPEGEGEKKEASPSREREKASNLGICWALGGSPSRGRGEKVGLPEGGKKEVSLVASLPLWWRLHFTSLPLGERGEGRDIARAK
jgi:hypothetical protein